jgi:type IV pilus assembly protein PilM
MRPSVGLDISDDAIRCVSFSHKGSTCVLSKYSEKRLAKGVIDTGYIHDTASVVSALSNIQREVGASFVNASLPEEKMYLFKTEIIGSTISEIRQNIEFKLEENVPLSPGDAVFSFDVIPSTDSKKMAIVSVASRKVVDVYLDVIQSAGFTVLSFESPAKALSRSLIAPDSKETVLMINIMKNKTGVYVVSRNSVWFTSTVAWGGVFVDQAIQTAFNVSPEEAEHIKMDAGYHDQKDTKKILDNVLGTLSLLERELNRVYAYWVEHGEGNKQIDKIIVSGMDALLVGLISHISPNPRLPVEIANTWRNAFSYNEHIPKISYESSLDYAVAAGLALPR